MLRKDVEYNIEIKDQEESEDSIRGTGIDCRWLVDSVYCLGLAMKMKMKKKNYRVVGMYRCAEKLVDTVVNRPISAHNMLCNLRMRRCDIEKFARRERESACVSERIS